MKKPLNRIEEYIHEMRYKNIDNILITKNGQTVYLKNFNKEFEGKKHPIASVVKSIISLGTGIFYNQYDELNIIFFIRVI